jgi:DNA-binding XRE family transcriptional regulator
MMDYNKEKLLKDHLKQAVDSINIVIDLLDLEKPIENVIREEKNRNIITDTTGYLSQSQASAVLKVSMETLVNWEKKGYVTSYFVTSSVTSRVNSRMRRFYKQEDIQKIMYMGIGSHYRGVLAK